MQFIKKLVLKKKSILLVSVFIISGFSSCSANEEKASSEQKTGEKSSISHIKGVEEFNRIVESSGKDLLIFDFYADWCQPCKILSPMLEKIANEQKEKVTIYKVNVDNNKNLSGAVGVRGIPFVILVKNKSVVKAFTGVQPRENYISAIDKHFEG